MLTQKTSAQQPSLFHGATADDRTSEEPSADEAAELAEVQLPIWALVVSLEHLGRLAGRQHEAMVLQDAPQLAVADVSRFIRKQYRY